MKCKIHTCNIQNPRLGSNVALLLNSMSRRRCWNWLGDQHWTEHGEHTPPHLKCVLHGPGETPLSTRVVRRSLGCVRGPARLRSPQHTGDCREAHKQFFPQLTTAGVNWPRGAEQRSVLFLTSALFAPAGRHQFINDWHFTQNNDMRSCRV